MRKINRKGSLTLFFVFLVVGIIIILVSAVMAPLGIQFNTAMYEASQGIIENANESIQNINNATIRNSIMSNVNAGYNAVDNNIEIINAFYQYGWIFFVVLTSVILFMLTRALVEVRTGGGLT